MRFGMGVDSITEEVRGQALVFQGEQQDPLAQIVKASVRMVESQSDLMEAMNISAGLSARYGLAEGDLKVELATQHAVNEYSLSMLFKAEVNNAPRTMVNPVLTADAATMYRRDPNRFRDIYGDTYIDEIYGGGELFGLFVFNTRDENSRSDLKLALDVSIGTFLAGGDLKASFQNTINRHSRTATMQIWALLSGGAGLTNPRDLDDLGNLYSDFNRSVAAHPIDYRASLKEFKYLPLPETETWLNQVVRRDTIERCGHMVIEGIALRAKLDYVLANPGQFEPFDRDALEAMRVANLEAMRQSSRRANDCAADLKECNLIGIDPVRPVIPRRLASTNPLATKWELLLQNDEAREFFSEGYLEGAGIDGVQHANGGIYKFFVRDGRAIAGIFWHRDISETAIGVYGPIFAEYHSRDHCQGRLGFPTKDVEPLAWGKGPNRICSFQNGHLWFDSETGVVSDKAPRGPGGRAGSDPA
jgi:hypothetical protein